MGTDVYGTPSSDPVSSGSFSVNFEAAVPGWDQFLLATGACNHWLVTTKEQAIGADGLSWYSNAAKTILASDLSPTAVSAGNWYRRQGNSPDPWIQAEPSHSQATALYVEGNVNANSGNGYGAQFLGLNVYVRNSLIPPPTPAPSASPAPTEAPTSSPTASCEDWTPNSSCKQHWSWPGGPGCQGLNNLQQCEDYMADVGWGGSSSGTKGFTEKHTPCFMGAVLLESR